MATHMFWRADRWRGSMLSKVSTS